MSAVDDRVAKIRRFNRFYTHRMGLLEEGLYHSTFSLTEARVLYELAHRDGLSATELGRDLGLDAGYLSRILRRFESAGLITRHRSTRDGRQQILNLTDAGGEAFAPLDEASRAEIAAMLSDLPPASRDQLVSAMHCIERLLDKPAEPPPAVLRAPEPGDLGWVVHRHGALYASEYGWDASFEMLVARIVADFAEGFDPRRDRCWIAEQCGAIVGSVFVVRDAGDVAKLRLLYVEPTARGQGIGHRLVEAATSFAREAGYARLTLWTNDVLTAARRIYESSGFRLVREEPHHSFGKDLVGQYWELDL